MTLWRYAEKLTPFISYKKSKLRKCTYEVSELQRLIYIQNSRLASRQLLAHVNISYRIVLTLSLIVQHF